MPWPAGNVQVGAKGENANLHIWVDGTDEDPKSSQVAVAAPTVPAIPSGNFMEMLLGHRSGGTNKQAPWGAPGSVAGGSGGTVTYAAATVTDTNQLWVVNSKTNFGVWAASGQWDVVASNTATVLTLKSNWAATPGAATAYLLTWVAEQNQGATVSYTATTLTDSSKTWTVNQWRGFWVYSGAGSGLVLSNTATVLTLAWAWSTTPGAQQAYFLSLPRPSGWPDAQMGGVGVPGAGFVGHSTNPENL